MKSFVGLLLLVGFIAVYWKLVVLGLVFWAVVKAAPVAWRELQEERAGRRARAEGLRARADQQTAWYDKGDSRWLHGQYPPAVGG